MEDHSGRLLNIRVGWGEPTEEEDFIFNFHINMGLVCWREMADYKSLCTLNIAFKESSSEYSNIPFPAFGKRESQVIMELMRQTECNVEKIKAIERHRAMMEIWINCIMNNIFLISSDARHICRCLFFSSNENTARFDGWMRANGVHEANLDSIEEAEESRMSTHALFSIMGNNKADNSMVLNRRNLNKTLKKKDYLRSNVAGSETNNSDKNSETKSVISSFFKHKARTVMSEETATEDVIQALSAQNKTSVVMTTEVQRGLEAQSGVIVYSIYLRVQGKTTAPIIHRVFQRYNGFKQLWNKLLEINEEVTSGRGAVAGASGRNNSNGGTGLSAKPAYANFIRLIASPFPASPIKSYLGLSLNEAELTERTRMLDAWFRDVCYYYRDMPATAREAVRGFLSFDMRNTKDMFVHDQLAWGIIEGQKVDAPIIIVRKTSVVTLHDSAQSAPDLDSTRSASIRFNLKEGKLTPKPIVGVKKHNSGTSTTGSITVDPDMKNIYHHHKQNHIGKKASSVC